MRRTHIDIDPDVGRWVVACGTILNQRPGGLGVEQDSVRHLDEYMLGQNTPPRDHQWCPGCVEKLPLYILADTEL